jgi:hypothetical protein
MTDQSPSRSLDKIIIRLPDGLKERIRRVAEKNDRSVNAELLVLLERAYPPEAIIDECVQEIADLVKAYPADDRRDLWRSIIGKLETFSRENS